MSDLAAVGRTRRRDRFELAASLDELSALLAEAIATVASLSIESPIALATIAARADHPALMALADALAVDVVTFEAAELATIATPHQSEVTRRETGTGSVAEAAALLASGAAEFVVPRLASAHATIALAGFHSAMPIFRPGGCLPVPCVDRCRANSGIVPGGAIAVAPLRSSCRGSPSGRATKDWLPGAHEPTTPRACAGRTAALSVRAVTCRLPLVRRSIFCSAPTV